MKQRNICNEKDFPIQVISEKYYNEIDFSVRTYLGRVSAKRYLKYSIASFLRSLLEVKSNKCFEKNVFENYIVIFKAKIGK